MSAFGGKEFKGSGRNPEDYEIPETLAEVIERMKGEGLMFPANSKKWYSKEENDKLAKYLWAAPWDARFPQTHTTRNCTTNYLDYHRCIELKGEDYKPCKYFKNVYMSVCPLTWIEKWDDWFEQGVFPGDFTK